MPTFLKKHLQEKIDAFNAPQKASYTLSLSLGIVRFDPSAPANLGKLLTQADAVMYEEKKKKSTLPG